MTADDQHARPSGPAPEQERSALLFMLEDLERERHRIEQAHREWQTAFDAVTDPIFLYDQSYRILRANRAYTKRAGMSLPDIIGKLYFEVFPKLGHPIIDSLRNSEAGIAKSEIQLITGEIFLSKSFPVYNEARVYLYSLHILEDVTQYKQADKSVRRTQRALKVAAACSREMLQANDELQMLQTVCRVAAESGWYRIAWVGYAEQDEAKTVRPVAYHGYETSFPQSLHPTWADTEYGHGPVGTAIRTGKTVIAQDVINDPRLEPWRRDAVQHGYASAVGLPLASGARVFGALCLCASESFAFSEEEVAVLEELAASVAFGVTSFRVRTEQNESMRERVQYLEALRSNLEDVVEAIVAAMEKRNPYAIGHQHRVANLAMAIALEMGLPQEQARGLHLAGLVHDVGEIQVADEIFLKTGKLTDAEFTQIKHHPQAGYDILKEINFPWPVAQAVLQHHEKLDGSGYPNGLKGNEILLEARILAVAETIEVLAYEQRLGHPRLGAPAALLEIERNKGKFYDEAVVDAALRLFREKKFEAT